MNPGRSTTLLALTLIIMALVTHGADVLDRIAAIVNGQIILQSDCDDAIRYDAFVNKRPPDTISSADRKAALDHLIDQELLREQIRTPGSAQPAEEEVEAQVKEIREQYEPKSDTEWKALLASHRLTEDELRVHVTLQLELTRLVDLHLRPAANISSKNIESYYRQELLPQLRQSGAKEVPLAEVSPKIKELLVQQKIDELLIAWLQDLRTGSKIQTHLFSSPDESMQR